MRARSLLWLPLALLVCLPAWADSTNIRIVTASYTTNLTTTLFVGIPPVPVPQAQTTTSGQPLSEELQALAGTFAIGEADTFSVFASTAGLPTISDELAGVDYSHASSDVETQIEFRVLNDGLANLDLEFQRGGVAPAFTSGSVMLVDLT